MPGYPSSYDGYWNSIKCNIHIPSHILCFFVKNEAKKKRNGTKKKKQKQNDRNLVDDSDVNIEHWWWTLNENICQYLRVKNVLVIHIDVKSHFTNPWTNNNKKNKWKENKSDAHFKQCNLPPVSSYHQSFSCKFACFFFRHRFGWNFFSVSVADRIWCLFFTWINHWKFIERFDKRIWFLFFFSRVLFRKHTRLFRLHTIIMLNDSKFVILNCDESDSST